MDKYEGLRGYRSGDQWVDDAIAALLNEREAYLKALKSIAGVTVIFDPQPGIKRIQAILEPLLIEANRQERAALAASEPSTPK